MNKIIWQIDFYKCDRKKLSEEISWQLLICREDGEVIFRQECLQKEANSAWLSEQLAIAIKKEIPDLIQVFRSQSLGLLTLAANQLNIPVEATRHTPALKQELSKNEQSITLDKPPPQPLSENLWGDEWCFASFPAGEIVEFFSDRFIPITNIPSNFEPIKLGVASNIPIPGIIIYAGKRSKQLATWLEEVKPVAVNFVPTEVDVSGGLILESGLIDRWILITFEDGEVSAAAANYQRRLDKAKGLHFLLIQPDNSGMTYSGFWLLKED